jgi:hypothetical protein
MALPTFWGDGAIYLHCDHDVVGTIIASDRNTEVISGSYQHSISTGDAVWHRQSSSRATMAHNEATWFAKKFGAQSATSS